MKTENSVGTKIPNKTLAELTAKIQETTNLSLREIGSKAGYSDPDYLSRMQLKERKGETVPPLLFKKLMRAFEVELTGSKRFEGGDDLMKKMMEETMALRSTVYVLTKALADLTSDVHGTKPENEYEKLRNRTAEGVVSVLQKW